MASFVVTLIQRMPASTFGWPATDIALVKFGNGEAIPKGDGTYFVAPAHKLAALTGEALDNNMLIEKLYQDVMGLWDTEGGGAGGWKMGFNNIGQGLLLASEIIDTSDRTEGQVSAAKKIVLLTKGLRSGCTEVKRLGEKAKQDGTIVDVVLFSGTYESNPTQFEVLQESVSFPWESHFHPVGALSKLNDWSYRTETAQDLIPKICPNAVSPKEVFDDMCKEHVLLLHRGRTCHDWNYELCEDGPVDLEGCGNLASRNGFKGFIHTKLPTSDEEGSSECNCLAKIKAKEKDENGQEKPGQADVPHPDAAGDQMDKDMMPLESTCKNKQKQNEGGEKEGWLYQAPAAGDGDMTSHYMVVSESECPRSWSDFRYKAFANSYSPEQYFAGAKAINTETLVR